MAVSLTPLLTLINNCDAITGWSGGALDTEKMREGTGCLGAKVSAALGIVYKYDQGGAGGVDMTGQHFFVWMMSTSTIDTLANGGMRIYAEDTSGAWIEWWVGGSDNYGGGWQRFCASSGAIGQLTSGTYNPALHRYIGIRFKTTGKSTVNNTFWDFLHYGSGIKIKSAATDNITWQDVFAADDAAAYGIVSKLRGMFFIQGRLEFGDTGSGDIDFLDTSQIVLFQDSLRVASTLYQVIIQGNAAGTTNFQLGLKSGESGISGCILKSGGATKFSIIATDTNIDELKLYGCTFLDAGTISLPPNATGREILNCGFEAGAEVLADTCIVKNCNFISPDNRGVRMSSITHNTTSCNFINCTHGVHVNNIGTYTFNALMFSGNTYDIENSSTGLVTVNATNGANPTTFENTGGGSVTILNPKTLTVTVKDSSTNPIQGAQVWIQKDLADAGFGHEGNPFTSAAGNNQGDVDFVVTQAVPTDLPASGLITVNDISEGEPQSYRYASKSGSTFTFPATVTGTDNGTGNPTTINETGIGAKNIIEGDTIRNTIDTQFAIVLSVSANSVTTTALSGGASWASDSYSVHTLAVTYISGTDTATVPLMNEETNASGVATESYNFGVNKAVVIRIRKSSSEPQYLPYSTTGTVTGNFSLEATLTEDAVFV